MYLTFLNELWPDSDSFLSVSFKAILSALQKYSQPNKRGFPDGVELAWKYVFDVFFSFLRSGDFQPVDLWGRVWNCKWDGWIVSRSLLVNRFPTQVFKLRFMLFLQLFSRKPSIRRLSVTSQDLLTVASCWTRRGISFQLKSSWQIWYINHLLMYQVVNLS